MLLEILVINRKQYIFLLLFIFSFGLQQSEASVLSQQYTSSWASPNFFPLATRLFRIVSVKNETRHDASFDILSYLGDKTRQELATRGFKESLSGDLDVINIELRIHLYQEGGTFGRWIGLGGGAGAAYAVVYAAFRKSGQSVGAELLTVSVIGSGGVFSAGAEKSVLKETATEISDFLQGANNK